MNKMKRMKNYCTCGAYWTGDLADDSYDAIEAQWQEGVEGSMTIRSGPGARGRGGKSK